MVRPDLEMLRQGIKEVCRMGEIQKLNARSLDDGAASCSTRFDANETKPLLDGGQSSSSLYLQGE